MGTRRQISGRSGDESGGDSGAAALEFALVLPVLALILFAVIDFGIFFANAIDAGSGVQEATRQAVVASFDPNCTPPSDVGGATGDIPHLMCMVASRTSPLAGDTYVKVLLPDGWEQGKQLVVCSVVVPTGLVGYVPLPHSGKVHAKSVMTIEQPTNRTETGGVTGPDNLDWSWCTP